jgi:hypothetical protein
MKTTAGLTVSVRSAKLSGAGAADATVDQTRNEPASRPATRRAGGIPKLLAREARTAEGKKSIALLLK